MKSLTLVSLFVFALFSFSAQAVEKKTQTEEDYYVAVVTSAHYAYAKAEVAGGRLVKLALTQTFRCPGCYEFEATFEGTENKVVEKFRTSLSLQDQTIEVTIAE